MNNEDVVVKYQAQIEVYPSQSGYVVLKQECMFEEPSVIDILPEHINAIVDALLAAKNFLLNEAE